MSWLVFGFVGMRGFEGMCVGVYGLMSGSAWFGGCARAWSCGRVCKCKGVSVYVWKNAWVGELVVDGCTVMHG